MEVINWDNSKQQAMIQMLISDYDLFTTVKPILVPEYFDKNFQHLIQYLLDFTTKYNALPTLVQIIDEARMELRQVSQVELTPEVKQSICDMLEKFCKQRALEIAVVEAAERINKGESSGIDTLIKNAQMVSLEKDLGIDFWQDQLKWLNQIDVQMGCLSTGWKTLDNLLNGGFSWGDLVYVVSCSGGGKSLALANLGLNYSRMGYNVAYLTLELDKALVGKRIMAMATNMAYKKISQEPEIIIEELKKKQNGKIEPGIFRLIDVENGSTPQDVEALLKEVETKTGKTINVIIVDYADLMRCNEYRQVKADNTHLIGKKIAEELRALATKRTKMGKRTVILSASQIGKDAMSEMEYDMNNIAGSAGKSFTADLIFSVRTNLAMKQRGEYELKIIKARNSGATDRKIKLKYNIESLLMEDLEEITGDTQQTQMNTNVSNSLNTLSFMLQQNAVKPVNDLGVKNEN